MNGFGVVVIIFIGLVILSVIISLARGIVSTRRMSGEGHWPAAGAEIGGIEPHGHHHGIDSSHHHAAGHHDMGGGGHMGGGHHG